MSSRGWQKVKITVLRRFSPLEVFERSPVTTIKPLKACERVREGQEFIVGEDGNMPSGFCTSAWVSIYPNVRVLALGGNHPNIKEKGVIISCCTDGKRPVIFKLERIQLLT
jgi:uncharacterized repeat protein (TIGR04076 family)